MYLCFYMYQRKINISINQSHTHTHGGLRIIEEFIDWPISLLGRSDVLCHTSFKLAV